jgi:uncharacterized membrane protein
MPRLTVTLNSLFAVFALLFVIIERRIYIMKFHDFHSDFDNLYGPYIGMLVGTFVVAQMSSYLLEKQRYKLSVVIAGLIIVGLIVTFVPFIREFLLWVFGFVSRWIYSGSNGWSGYWLRLVRSTLFHEITAPFIVILCRRNL